MSDSAIGKRKDDHLALCATGDVGFRTVSTLLEEVRLVHDALPELDHGAIDASVTLFGKRLAAPIFIAGMTGGTDEAGRINRDLAGVAESLGIGFGLGSQRPMLRHKEALPSYRARDAAPRTLLLGNVGGVQAAITSDDELRALAASVDIDALCIHLNPAQELVQPGGDRDFRGISAAFARVERAVGRPVIAKETGAGLGPRAADKLVRAGVRHVDVSGAGGTSWVAVETHRARSAADDRAAALGEALRDWGIPTAVAVAVCAPRFETVLATGGISSGHDVARAIALGAKAAGIARPVLIAHREGGAEGAKRFLEGVIAELRAVMLLTGSADLAALAGAPRVLGPTLSTWLSQLGVTR